MSKNDPTSTVRYEDRPEGGLRRKIFIVIFEAETRLGKIFDVVLLWAILLSIVLVVLESDSSLNSKYGSYFDFGEWLITGFFTVEYLLRLYTSRKPMKYAFSFFGIIDFIATLPAYLSLVLPQAEFLMVVRVLRLLRVFRVLKLVRYTRAAQHLSSAFYASRYKISIFFGVIASLVLVMGTCMYLVEGEQSGFSSIPRSMYWTIVTMTTVGYGDIVPLTTLGKLVASMMMLTGYAIIAVPTGIVTSELNELQYNSRPKHKVKCKQCYEALMKNTTIAQSAVAPKGVRRFLVRVKKS